MREWRVFAEPVTYKEGNQLYIKIIMKCIFLLYSKQGIKDWIIKRYSTYQMHVISHVNMY